jgi:hypothetical protein
MLENMSIAEGFYFIGSQFHVTIQKSSSGYFMQWTNQKQI